MVVCFDCGVWVLHIEVKSPLQVLDLHFPGDFVFLAFVPPVDEAVEFLELDGFGLRIAFLAFGQAVFPIPDFPGGCAFFEKEQVGGDSGGKEGGLREADDGVQVAVAEELFADAFFVPISSDAAIGQDDGAATAGLEELDHEDDKEVGGLPAAEGGGEVGLDAVGDAGTEGGIGEDDFHLLAWADGVVFRFEAVDVVPVGHVDAVHNEVGEAKHVGDGLEFPAADRLLQHSFVVQGAHIAFADEVDGGTEKAACPGGGVEHPLPEPGSGHLGHELRDGARGIELALVSGVAQFDEDRLIDGAKDVAVFGAVEVKAVELVDDLAHLVARLHVVVGSVKYFPHECGSPGMMGGLELPQVGKQAGGGVVDEVDEVVARDALRVGGPVAPLQALGDDGLIALPDQFEFLVFFVEDLEEEHPAKLLQPLGVARDAAILPHDVADVFDDG